MNELKSKLENLSENRLIDVVKNYRQYGYSEEHRNLALNILKERGLDDMTLKLRGQFDNETYDEAQNSFDLFIKNSRVAFTLYMVSIGSIFLLPFFTSSSFSSALILIVTFAYLVYFILSFINQSNFYKAIGKTYAAENPFIFLLLGMPFYFIVYFYFKNKMRQHLKEVT